MPGSVALPDQNKALTIIAPYVILLTIGTALVISRIYVRAKIVRAVRLDDYTIVFALLLAVTYLGLISEAIHSGFGRHMRYLSAEQISHIKKMFYISEPTIVFSCMFTRISVALLLKRLFGINKKRIFGLYFLAGIIAFTTIPVGIMDLLQCRPMHSAWDHTTGGKCWGPNIVSAISNYQCVIAVTYDFVLATLPILFLWRFQENRLTKVGIGCLLGLGCFPAIIRLVAAVLYSSPNSVDFTYASVDRLLLRFLEELIGIIAACIPTLRPLFRFKGALNANNQSTGSNDAHRLNRQKRFQDPFSITRALQSTTEDLDGSCEERSFSNASGEQIWVSMKGSQWIEARTVSLTTNEEVHGIYVPPGTAK